MMTTNTVADDGLSTFMRLRPRLLAIARRMLGCAAAAEDIVQDVWLRWQRTDHRAVRDPGAFLATATTRMAINVIQSSRSRRETSVGPWMPEPVDLAADPGVDVERGQALASGVALLRETLSPTERAAFVLREAFEYPYRDIANALQLAEANARQIVTRARQRVATRRPRGAARSQQAPVSGQWLVDALGGPVMKRTAAALALTLLLAGVTLTAQDGPVRPLVTKDLAGVAGREVTMLTVDYAPGASSPAHTHHAQALVYVLEGSIVMQLEGQAPVTLTPGQTFYEGLDDVHVVSKNASATKPAKFVVFLVKDKGAPILTPVK